MVVEREGADGGRCRRGVRTCGPRCRPRSGTAHGRDAPFERRKQHQQRHGKTILISPPVASRVSGAKN